MNDIKLLSTYVDEIEYKNELYDIPWKIFYDKNKKCREYTKDLNILILNTPCMGFGDIVFAMKLKQYIIDWYKCGVTIATTDVNKFIQLGESSKNLLLLKGNHDNSQCRKFKNLNIYKFNGKTVKLPIFDIIFVAPLTADFNPDYRDVKYIIPYSNRFNTFFFSEYNDDISKDIDFHTGIGSDRLGLFLTKIKNNTKLPQIKNRYAVIYIAETITGSNKCFLSFMEMIAKKYHKMYPNFDIVVPEWIIKKINSYKNSIVKILKKYYGNIVVISKDDHKYLLEGENKRTINIRGDIFPLQNKNMIRLIKYSVRDILLTGDQSITDALSCCYSEKNIFYQIAPWKRNFGTNLSKQLPNKFLSKKSTSCGTIQAIKYHSQYKGFIKKWDFRKLAKQKMDAIFLAAINRINNDVIIEFENIVLESKTINSFDKKYDSWIEELD